jgi:hypothetical protein
MARYEDSRYMAGKLYPIEFAAKLSVALVGKGSPPITAEEIWRLAELKSGLLLAPVAVAAIPVIRAETLMGGAQALRDATPSGGINVAGLEGGNYFALEAETLAAAQVAPPGSHVIIDAADQELRDNRRYLVILNDALELRHYHSNPARFESLAMPPAATVYPTGRVEVLGRAIRTITDL